jgi:hypothetical protein
METHIGLGFLLNGRARHRGDGAHGRSSAKQGPRSARSATRSSSTPREDAPVANLIARTPFDGHLPLIPWIGRGRRGRPRDDHLRRPLRRSGGWRVEGAGKGRGLRPAAVGAFSYRNGATRVAWSGLDQWFVMGPEPVSIPGAALTDQSDAWARSGCPAPDRAMCWRGSCPSTCAPACSRSDMPRARCWGTCPASDAGGERTATSCLVFRSMAASAAHDLDRAMRMVRAGGAEPQ